MNPRSVQKLTLKLYLPLAVQLHEKRSKYCPGESTVQFLSKEMSPRPVEVSLAMPVFSCQHLIVVGFVTLGFGFYAFLVSTIGPALQHGTLRAVLAKHGREHGMKLVILVSK